jgi:hypothetical protein
MLCNWYIDLRSRHVVAVKPSQSSLHFVTSLCMQPAHSAKAPNSEDGCRGNRHCEALKRRAVGKCTTLGRCRSVRGLARKPVCVLDCCPLDVVLRYPEDSTRQITDCRGCLRLWTHRVVTAPTGCQPCHLTLTVTDGSAQVQLTLRSLVDSGCSKALQWQQWRPISGGQAWCIVFGQSMPGQ